MSINKLELHPRSVVNELFFQFKSLIGKCVVRGLDGTDFVNLDPAVLRGKTISVVGNAPVEKDFGDDIDRKDIVIRCNKGVIPGVQNSIQKVGKRTDILVAGALSIVTNPRIITFVRMHPEVLVVSPFYIGDTTVSINTLATQAFFKNRANYITQSVSTEIRELTGKYRPSTGFTAIALAKIFGATSIDIYGFNFSDFNRVDQRRNYTTQHDFDNEKDIVSTWGDSGEVIINS